MDRGRESFVGLFLKFFWLQVTFLLYVTFYISRFVACNVSLHVTFATIHVFYMQRFHVTFSLPDTFSLHNTFLSRNFAPLPTLPPKSTVKIKTQTVAIFC